MAFAGESKWDDGIFCVFLLRAVIAKVIRQSMNQFLARCPFIVLVKSIKGQAERDCLMIEGEEWDELNESIRSLLFKYGFLSPSAWKRKGARLKYAAHRLFDLYHEAVTRFLERFSKEAEEGTGPIASWHTATEAELGKEVTDISLITEYCLLMGYALENLLKGILMAEHPEYFKPDAKITDIRSHNLVSLCKRCSLHITADEEELLKKLTDHIEWVGKYPVPLEMSGMYPRRKPDGTWDGPGDKLKGQDTKNTVENLYERFWDELTRRERAE